MKACTYFPVATFLFLAPMTPAAAQAPAVTLIGPSPFGWQGHSVAIDGNLAVVGAPVDDTNGTNTGRVRVYNVTTGALLHTILNPAPSADDNFGYSVAISGNRIVVGAYLDNSGAGTAYVYDLSTASPTVPILTLNKPNTPTPIAAGDRFGNSVAISGTRIVVGAYRDSTGAPGAGSAYVYDLNNISPTVPIAILNNPAPVEADWFGYSTAISGTRIVIGAYQDDVGSVFFAGRAFVYDLNSPTPTVPVHTLSNPTPEQSDNFGYSVGISGSRVVVGASQDDTGATNTGSAYVYELASGTATLVATLNDPAPVANNWFGAAVAISGLRVVVGSLNNNTGGNDSGRAYIYELLPTLPMTTLSNPTPAAADWYGTSVAVAGDNIIIGAPGDNQSTEDEYGAAYLYRFPSARISSSITRLPNGNIQTQFNALNGLNFEIRRSTDLTNWPLISSAIAGPSGITYTDSTPPQPRCFYRLQMP